MVTPTGYATLLAGTAIVGAFAILFGLLGTAFKVLHIIAEWKIFEKAGEKGWKALIPIYNIYIAFKLFWNTKMFWATFILTCVAFIASPLFALYKTAAVFVFVMMFVILAIVIYLIIIGIMFLDRVSRSFGHDGAFTCGLVFLTPIFEMILGFNKDKYKKLKK